jgi:hypothetical protein
VRSGRVAASVMAAVLGVAGSGCGGGAHSAAQRQAEGVFVSQVHAAAPDVGGYRSDAQLVRLGHAACDGFRSGVSYQQLADRLELTEGPNPLPAEDLGAVISAAVNELCPQYRSQLG